MEVRCQEEGEVLDDSLKSPRLDHQGRRDKG